MHAYGKSIRILLTAVHSFAYMIGVSNASHLYCSLMFTWKNKMPETLYTIIRIAGVLVGVSLASLTASATTIIEERFDYEGDILAGANGGIGWRDSWKSTPQLDTESGAVLGAQSLPAPQGYPSAVEKRLSLIDPGGQPTAYRGLDPSAIIYFDENRTYFVSFLVRRSQSGYGFALRQGANTTVVGVTVSTGGAITLTLDGQSATSANVISNDTSYLFVLKIETAASGLDRVYLSRYAESQTLPEEEPETWLLEVAAETSLFAERVAFLGGGNRTIEFDEFRVGTTWAGNVYEVPSSFGLTLEQSSDLATWNQVLITSDMVGPAGRIFLPDADGNKFFRMRIDAKEEE